jgi:hypothetical protein
VVAINFDPNYSLEEWTRFWQGIGAGDVLWAQDTTGSAIRAYELVALGTEVIVDRNGDVAFRSDGPAGLNRLRSEIEMLL